MVYQFWVKLTVPNIRLSFTYPIIPWWFYLPAIKRGNGTSPIYDYSLGFSNQQCLISRGYIPVLSHYIPMIPPHKSLYIAPLRNHGLVGNFNIIGTIYFILFYILGWWDYDIPSEWLTLIQSPDFQDPAHSWDLMSLALLRRQSGIHSCSNHWQPIGKWEKNMSNMLVLSTFSI